MNENLDKETNFHIQLLSDTLKDLKEERAFIRRICYILCGAIILLIGGIIFSNIYHQKKLLEFMEDIDITSTTTIDTDSGTNYGNIIGK